MTALTLLRAERLCLLTDAHKARKTHRAVSGIETRLRAVTALIAAMEARHG